MINPALIEKFFRNECSPEERARVADYLQSHPDLMEKYLSEEEYLQYPEGERLQETVSGRMLTNIHRELPKNKRTVLRWTRWAAAAVLLGIIVLSVTLFHHPAGPSRLAIRNIRPGSPEEAQLIRQENTTGSMISVRLPDGSSVWLYPAGSITYSSRFSANRNIMLEGEAIFNVVTDKLHTFTVQSGEMTTRVLGTSFMVRSFERETTITVRLNSGKVLVAASRAGHKTIEDVVLTTGKELIYNKKDLSASVRSFLRPNKETLVQAGNGSNKAAGRPDWFRFSNQPLAEVLDQLSNFYGVPIYYYPSDIGHIYFEGKFDRTDSLEKILADIVLPNHLTLIRENDKLIIKKDH
jgi:transmembrane sensor